MKGKVVQSDCLFLAAGRAYGGEVVMVAVAVVTSGATAAGLVCR